MTTATTCITADRTTEAPKATNINVFPQSSFSIFLPFFCEGHLIRNTSFLMLYMHIDYSNEKMKRIIIYLYLYSKLRQYTWVKICNNHLKSDVYAKVRWSILKSNGLPRQSSVLAEYVYYVPSWRRPWRHCSYQFNTNNKTWILEKETSGEKQQ